MTDRLGMPLSRVNELKIFYPTVKVVRSHTQGGYARMIYLEIPDVARREPFRISIHYTGTPDIVPTAYVINGKEKGHVRFIHGAGRKLHDYDRSLPKIPGTNIDGYWICHGYSDIIYRNLSNDPVKRLMAFINQLTYLLND